MSLSYRNLDVWQKSVTLSLKVINFTNNFPNKFRFSLCNQMDRSAISVPSNIAEGAGRNSTKEYIQFLGVAHGSLLELETQILIANKLNLIPDNDYNQFITESGEIGRMLKGLQKSLKNRIEASISS